MYGKEEQDECGGEAGWNSEQTLDVEAVHGMAPGANVHYIGAQNCDTGIDDGTSSDTACVANPFRETSSR